jgi:HD superfamily phosphohydrolase
VTRVESDPLPQGAAPAAPRPPACPPPLVEQVHQFAEDVMRGYEGTPPRRAKYLRDALHGSIVVEPHEVPFIDAPLFQRLRGIFQTGPVYLTYPSARHSRFEHSVGVMHLAGRMVARLADLAAPGLPREHVRAVRLAALLHDIGHGVFSHSSEKVILATPLLAAQLDPALPGLQPHEKVGALLLTSRPMRRLFEQADVDAEAVVALITGDVAAVRARGLPAYLAGVISGPIDADKLDYFARDSLFSGVPAILDYDRLLQSLLIGEQGIQLSMAGAGELEKLLFNRLTMYHALYNHHKVQTADCMIQGVVEAIVGGPWADERGGAAPAGGLIAIAEDGPAGQACTIDFHRVVDFLRLSDEAFLHAPSPDPYVADVLHRLRTRRLLQRAFVLQRDTVTDIDDDTYLDFADAVRRRADEVRRRIYARVRAAVPTLQPAEVWVRPAVVPRVSDAGVIATAPAEGGGPAAGAPSRHTTIFSGWDPDVADHRVTNPVQRNYLLYKAPIYVFAPPPYLALVERAAIAVLHELFHDLLPRVTFLPRHRG